jgi:polyisoprenoid-binding protein YceI
MERETMKKLAALIALFTVTALVACANPAADKPQAAVAEPQPAAPPPAQAEEFKIGEGSSVEWVGSKVTGQHDGGFKNFEGTISVVDGDPTKSSVEVTIDTTSLWSDNERLTGHLKSADFFDVETYPQASFQSTSIVPAADGYQITGNLDLHGVTKSVTFPATIDVGADQVSAKAEFAIKRFDFGINYKGAADDLIRDDVVIRLNLVAQPAV